MVRDMKKFGNLYSKSIRLIFFAVIAIVCLIFIYSRYKDYSLTPKISQEMQNAPLKIDTSKMVLKNGKPYRLPSNIKKLVGIYKGIDDGQEIQVRVNPDGTYEKISRGDRVAKTYLDTEGNIHYKEEEKVGLEIGYLIEEGGYVVFHNIDDRIDDHTVLGFNFLADGLYINNYGEVDLLKSVFQEMHKKLIFNNDMSIDQDIMMIDEASMKFKNGSLLFDKEKLVTYSHYWSTSFRDGPTKVYYTPKAELTRSTDIYDVWNKPIEKWGIEEISTAPPTLHDFIQVYGTDIAKLVKKLCRDARGISREPSQTEIENYVSQNGRQSTNEELDFIEREYGVDLEFSYTIEMKQSDSTTFHVIGWSRNSGYKHFGVSDDKLK